MSFYSKSYNAAACCGDNCSYDHLSTEDEPCWGGVEVVGEDCTADYSDCWWYHACQGHHNFYDDAWDNPKYIPELQ
jgi:hypothetical protein